MLVESGVCAKCVRYKRDYAFGMVTVQVGPSKKSYLVCLDCLMEMVPFYEFVSDNDLEELSINGIMRDGRLVVDKSQKLG